MHAQRTQSGYQELGTFPPHTPVGLSPEKLPSFTKAPPIFDHTEMPPLTEDDESAPDEDFPPLTGERPKETIEEAFHMMKLRDDCLSLLANKANRFAVLQDETCPRVVSKKTTKK